MRLLLCALLGILLASCSGSDDKTVGKNNVEEKAPVLKYGLEIEKYEVVPGEIGKGDFFGSIMENFGVGANQVQKILKASEGVFDVRKIKLGSQYEVFVEKVTGFPPAYEAAAAKPAADGFID